MKRAYINGKLYDATDERVKSMRSLFNTKHADKNTEGSDVNSAAHVENDDTTYNTVSDESTADQ